MAEPSRNPAAPEHLPSFMAGADGSDPLLVTSGVILVTIVLVVGLLFLRLHTLPERLAHRGQKLQFELVAVLGLLALFTHMHIFWVCGLVLALVDIPDLAGPMRRIAGASEKVAGLPPGEGDTLADATGLAPPPHGNGHGHGHRHGDRPDQGPAPASLPTARPAGQEG